ncbi:ORF11 [Eptesicus fuscus gammaherpesvirus]|uniref:ORF11 n=1 Tax=vespertilionid gammaherpesvirus 3 TaxID=2846598 RepID=A0A2D1AF85_9GAMA|nr:ORF11 [Eptesicus fuscus gammaherpesvirus]ATA58245.1 ORF11 [Eptesicus fuscus gammaherpesvirus]WAH70901.1 virion protein G11 [Eptesicus fuscus gammaherpesvirus]
MSLPLRLRRRNASMSEDLFQARPGRQSQDRPTRTMNTRTWSRIHEATDGHRDTEAEALRLLREVTLSRGAEDCGAEPAGGCGGGGENRVGCGGSSTAPRLGARGGSKKKSASGARHQNREDQGVTARFFGSLRRSCTRSSSRRAANDGPWEIRVGSNYVRLSNRHDLMITPDNPQLPPCQSLSEMLREHMGGTLFEFDTTRWWPSCLRTYFLVYGHPENQVHIQPVFVRDPSADFRAQVLNPPRKITMLSKGSVRWCILPVVVLEIRGIYLRCLPEEKQAAFTDSCALRGTHLHSTEPRLFFSGRLRTDGARSLPYLIAPRTSAMSKRFAMLHASHGAAYKANSVHMSENYARVSVGGSCIGPEFDESVSVGMTMVDEATVAFDRNPMVCHPWVQTLTHVPIIYQGPPVVVAPGQSVLIQYNNRYTSSSLPDLTAMIINPRVCGELRIRETEWPQDMTAELDVQNTSGLPVRITTGVELGMAVFLLAASPGAKQYLPGLSITLPGKISILTSSVCSFKRLARVRSDEDYARTLFGSDLSRNFAASHYTSVTVPAT